MICVAHKELKLVLGDVREGELRVHRMEESIPMSSSLICIFYREYLSIIIKDVGTRKQKNWLLLSFR